MAIAASKSAALLSVIFLLSISAASASSYPDLPKFQSEMPSDVLALTLSNLGYHELAAAIRSSPTTRKLPLTVFAPSDESLRSCSPAAGEGCSTSRLLKQHLVPFFLFRFNFSPFQWDTKIRASPVECLRVTSVGSNKFFVQGVEIDRPNHYVDGIVAIHGIRGFIPTLSPPSCFYREGSARAVMLRDILLRLEGLSYRVSAQALRMLQPELADFDRMTVFAINDEAASAEGQSYSYQQDVKLHVVPNRLLMHSDLVRIEQGMVLPTMMMCEVLKVTQSGRMEMAGIFGLRINFAPIRAPDVVVNERIVVHGVFSSFPRLFDGQLTFGRDAESTDYE